MSVITAGMVSSCCKNRIGSLLCPLRVPSLLSPLPPRSVFFVCNCSCRFFLFFFFSSLSSFFPLLILTPIQGIPSRISSNEGMFPGPSDPATASSSVNASSSINGFKTPLPMVMVQSVELMPRPTLSSKSLSSQVCVKLRVIVKPVGLQEQISESCR